MRFYFKVTSLYGRFGNNIHSTTTADNHFHKSIVIPNKGIEDGGTFPLITHDWVGQQTSNNSKKRIIEKTIFNVNKIFKTSLRVDDVFLKFKWFM